MYLKVFFRVFFVSALALSLVAYTSCGSNDEDEMNSQEKQEMEEKAELNLLRQKIVGSWETVNFYHEALGDYMPYWSTSFRDTFTFKSDGTYDWRGAAGGPGGDKRYWKYDIKKKNYRYVLTMKEEKWNDERYFIIYGKTPNDTLRFIESSELVRVGR